MRNMQPKWFNPKPMPTQGGPVPNVQPNTPPPQGNMVSPQREGFQTTNLGDYRTNPFMNNFKKRGFHFNPGMYQGFDPYNRQGSGASGGFNTGGFTKPVPPTPTDPGMASGNINVNPNIKNR